MDARRLERCVDAPGIGLISQHLGDGLLHGPANGLINTFATFSRDVAVAVHQPSLLNQAALLSETANQIAALSRELTRSSDPYAQRFRLIADYWHGLMTQQKDRATELAQVRQEIPNPYVVGVPLAKRQDIFVGRIEIAQRIEVLIYDRDYPPVLLYGQRRMGKTSLLYQLRWLLPQRIAPLLIDLQGPASQATGL